MSTGQGSAGNVIAALCSFLFPGLGQLLQGRPVAALVFFLLSIFFWCFLGGLTIGTLPSLIHIISSVEAAVWKPSTNR